MTKFALLDLDGTLIDSISCTSFKEGESFDWAKFMERSRDCCTIQPTLDLMKKYQEEDVVCIICTARPEAFEDITIWDLTARKLGEDMIVMRNDELWHNELEALKGVTEEAEIKRIAHEHHAIYRQVVVEDLEDMYGKGCIKYAVDDQTRNLDTFLAHDIECTLVTDGKLSDYTGE